MSNQKGLLIVVSGPSGCGKGTVLSKALDESCAYSVSATTRAPREGEREGVNYYYLTREEFQGRVQRGEMLEYAEYCGEFYGTPEAEADKMLEDGKNVILEIEVQGAMQVKKRREDAVLVFILPPSLEELERRLRGRETESDEKVAERLSAAEQELNKVSEYNYAIINDDVDTAAADFRAVMRAERLRVRKDDIIC